MKLPIAVKTAAITVVCVVVGMLIYEKLVAPRFNTVVAS